MKRTSLLLVILFEILTTVPAFTAELAFPTPTAKEKCPVCGMFVSKYPEWVASITYKNQPSLFFDGAKDLFTYYLNPKKYVPKGTAPEVSSILVKDYYALNPINAKKALYVIGSNVFGPMGKELVPFEKPSDAKEFLKDHHGIKILRFDEITLPVLKALE